MAFRLSQPVGLRSRHHAGAPVGSALVTGQRLLAIVQARTSSTRLPGKVLLPLGTETVLGRVVRAVQAARAVDEVVVATSTGADDDAVAEECARIGVAVTRGPLDDVLRRFVLALDAHPADAVVRITADCPLLDPAVLRTACAAWRGVGDLDYLSTALVRTLPRGLDVEIVSASALRAADAVAVAHDRVHVTSHVYTHPDGFRLLGLNFTPSGGHLRATLDTEQDWQLVQAVVAAFGERQPTVAELVAWLDAHPEVAALNADVEQKQLSEG
jgi:spore coat polysaccharide biosynthesis protein SpsF